MAVTLGHDKSWKLHIMNERTLGYFLWIFIDTKVLLESAETFADNVQQELYSSDTNYGLAVTIVHCCWHQHFSNSLPFRGGHV